MVSSQYVCLVYAVSFEASCMKTNKLNLCILSAAKCSRGTQLSSGVKVGVAISVGFHGGGHQTRMGCFIPIIVIGVCNSLQHCYMLHVYVIYRRSRITLMGSKQAVTKC